jgi:hypothetical protein
MSAAGPAALKPRKYNINRDILIHTSADIPLALKWAHVGYSFILSAGEGGAYDDVCITMIFVYAIGFPHMGT